MKPHNSYNKPGDYDHFVVDRAGTLLEWLLENVKGLSRSKIKQTLQGRGIRVGSKVVTQFDYPVSVGTKIALSKTKRNNDIFKSRYVKIVYEDRHLVVV